MKNLTGRGKCNKSGACEEVQAVGAMFRKHSVIYAGIDRSHALRGNASSDALRHDLQKRTQSVQAGIPTQSVGTINQRPRFHR